MNSDSTTSLGPSWTISRIVVSIVIVAVASVAAPFIAALILRVLGAHSDPSLVIAVTWSSTLIGIPLMLWLASRVESDPWRFLAIRTVPIKRFALWCAALIAFVIVADVISELLGRPIVVEDFLHHFSAGLPIGIFIATVVVAPIVEELFFRGFLISATSAFGASQLVSAVISAGLFAIAHFQYGFYEVTTIFAGGLLLAAARIRTQSTVPCIAMHSIHNLIDFTKMASLAGASAA